MTHLKTVATFQGASGLPRDTFVNTFHFDGVLANPELASAAVERFYNHEFDAADGPLSGFISKYVNRTAGGLKIETYDMSAAPPRTPIDTLVTAPVAVNYGTGSLPFEVALCLSYYATVDADKFRGRIYIGPFALDASTRPDGGVPVPNSHLINVLKAAAADLKDNADVQWSVFSVKDSALRAITAGWVDNDFDTMRKRGPKATARNDWS